jgi:hypothetical protein
MVHLLKDNRFIEWNLAHQDKRATVIADAIDFVRLVVLPYFERFSDPGVLISDLGQREIPAFEIASSVEFALCFGTKKEARHVLDRFVMERRDLWEQIEQATLAFREQGLPAYQVTTYADQVAWVRTAYGLT